LPAPGQLKVTFKEGGGFEFSTIHKDLILRLYESEGTAPVEHTEPLPIYTPRQENSSSTAQTSTTFSNVVPPETSFNNPGPSIESTTSTSAEIRPPPVAPDELPPAYDEVVNR